MKDNKNKHSGQDSIDICPKKRYNKNNLIRKQSNHCCKLFDNGSHRYELHGTEWLYPFGASGTEQAPSGTFTRDKIGFLILTQIYRKVRNQATFIDLYLQFLTYVFRLDLNS